MGYNAIYIDIYYNLLLGFFDSTQPPPTKIPTRIVIARFLTTHQPNPPFPLGRRVVRRRVRSRDDEDESSLSWQWPSTPREERGVSGSGVTPEWRLRKMADERGRDG